jgi:predicted RNA-binding Zn ribbon-like protein
MPTTTTATEAQILPGLPAGELRFNLTPGRPALDLVATIGERWRRAFERLVTPADLARWIVAAGLAPSAPRVTAAHLTAARRLRGAVARVLLAWGSGAPLPPADLAIVNEAAAQPDLAPQLGRDGTPAGPAPATVTTRAVLATVARDAIDLVVHGAPARLRECGADDCATLFYDASRPGARRWCSMQTCGNRHKTAAYRARTR